MNWLEDFRHSLNWGLAMLAGLISAMSIIKVLVFAFDIGLIPLLDRIVAFYRGVLQPLYELVALLPLPFTIPQWAIDLLIVYFIGVTISYRQYQGLLLNIEGMLSYRFSPSISDSPDTHSYKAPKKIKYQMLRWAIKKPYDITMIYKNYKNVKELKDDMEQLTTSPMANQIKRLREANPAEWGNRTIFDYIDWSEAISIYRRALFSVALIPFVVIVFFAFNEFS